MNILSLFDGLSGARLALNKSGITATNYYSSEINRYALLLVKNKFPDTIFLGDVGNWQDWKLPKLDLLIAGSPCQGFSRSGKQLNFNDNRSILFFKFVEILEYYKPTYFLLENVKMKQEWQNIITDIIGIKPILINSSLLSAQNRSRLYWSNVPITIPDDKKIVIDTILEKNIDNKYFIGEEASKILDGIYDRNYLNQFNFVVVNRNGKISLTKSFTIEALYNKGVEKNFGTRPFLYTKNKGYRRFTPLECERLQTIPDNYTIDFSDTQRYKMIGNSFTIDIISHIFNQIPT